MIFESDSPLFEVPQTSHSRYSLRPVFASSRLPQSVQKTSEPMAAIAAACHKLARAVVVCAGVSVAAGSDAAKVSHGEGALGNIREMGRRERDRR